MFSLTKLRIAASTTIYHSARVLTPTRKGRKNCFCLRGFEKYLSDDVTARVRPQKFDFSACYTPEEQDIIKKTINTGTLDELKSYNITEARIKKIIAHRDKNVSFKSLDEILLFQGMDISVLDKFCRSIVNKAKPSKLPVIGSKSEILSPPLDEHKRLTINTCTGIWVSGKIVSWAQLDTNCNILEWDSESLGEISMKDGLRAVIDSVARIVSKMGPSDVYVMEADPIVPFSRMNSAAYYLNLQRQQIVASIASMLGTRLHRVDNVTSESILPINNIYTMRFRTAARLFNLLIGSENVSAESVVEKLLKQKKGHEVKEKGEIAMFAQVNPDLRLHYESQDNYQREQMNWALLLIVAFVNLSLVRSSAALQVMAKNGPRKKL